MSDDPAVSSKPKREAKKVEAFAPAEVKEKAEFVIKEGAGTKLGEIENVKVKIDKLNAGGEELKALHRLCFGRPGEKTKIKRNLREFSGIDDDEAAKKKESVAKLDGKLIKALLTTCDQPTTGTKAQNVDALIEFVKAPAASGKRSLVEKAGEKREKAARKRERVEKKKSKGKKGAGKKPASELKRPPNAFMLYCTNKRDKVRAENPEASMVEISKILGEKWKGISAERKANYEANAKELKEEYEKKKAALEAKSGGAPAKKKQKVAEGESAEAEEEDEEDEDEDDDEEDDEEEGGDEEESGEKEDADKEGADKEDADEE